MHAITFHLALGASLNIKQLLSVKTDLVFHYYGYRVKKLGMEDGMLQESTEEREHPGFVDWEDLDEDDEKYGKFFITESKTR